MNVYHFGNEQEQNLHQIVMLKLSSGGTKTLKWPHWLTWLVLWWWLSDPIG